MIIDCILKEIDKSRFSTSRAEPQARASKTIEALAKKEYTSVR